MAAATSMTMLIISLNVGELVSVQLD
ncbi:hypothetical protein CCACVL1_10714 [Corchorus capsularis]|uniref:Uncharacterized protein n=1 Tax=Corchorus capsularis TaxID=210143 RepID=A0A1R3IQ32_COCAP|nr:hypothetical protein CCACVL1_10714 [Corchorus capsularis]